MGQAATVGQLETQHLVSGPFCRLFGGGGVKTGKEWWETVRQDKAWQMIKMIQVKSEGVTDRPVKSVTNARGEKEAKGSLIRREEGE